MSPGAARELRFYSTSFSLRLPMQKCRRVSDRRREKETCLASFVHVCVPGVVCKVIARYMRTMMWEREREIGEGIDAGDAPPLHCRIHQLE